MPEHELPAGQLVQAALPSSENVPEAQSPEIVFVASSHDWPAGQGTHTVAPPVGSVYRLFAHATGLAETVLHECPAGHAVHDASPSRLYSPGAHSIKVLCSEHDMPAGHGEQDAASAPEY